MQDFQPDDTPLDNLLLPFHRADLLSTIYNQAARAALGAMRTSSTQTSLRLASIPEARSDILISSSLRLLHSPCFSKTCLSRLGSELDGIRAIRDFLRNTPILKLLLNGHPLIPKKLPPFHIGDSDTSDPGPGIYVDGSHGRSVRNTGAAATVSRCHTPSLLTPPALSLRIEEPFFSNAVSAEMAGLLLGRALQGTLPQMRIFSDNVRALSVAKYLGWSSSLGYSRSKCPGNLIADGLAKRAARSRAHPEYLPLIPILPECTRKFLVSSSLSSRKRSWADLCRSESVGVTIRSLLSDFSTGEALRPYISHRSFRCLQGHNRFSRHNALRQHPDASPTCLYCEEPHSSAGSTHLLFSCPNPGIKELRESFFKGEDFQELAQRKPKETMEILNLFGDLQLKRHRLPRRPRPAQDVSRHR